MEISTKFSVYDTCYYMENNKVAESKIYQIDINVFYDSYYNSVKTEITYRTDNGEDFLEKDIFKTKQALLNSL